jgi:hypothetical protein
VGGVRGRFGSGKRYIEDVVATRENPDIYAVRLDTKIMQLHGIRKEAGYRIALYRMVFTNHAKRYKNASCHSDCTQIGRLIFISYSYLTFESLRLILYTNRFNVQKFYVLPTRCIYVLCVDLRTNSDYFPIQH